jgi:hypothetical protein
VPVKEYRKVAAQKRPVRASENLGTQHPLGEVVPTIRQYDEAL